MSGSGCILVFCLAMSAPAFADSKCFNLEKYLEKRKSEGSANLKKDVVGLETDTPGAFSEDPSVCSEMLSKYLADSPVDSIESLQQGALTAIHQKDCATVMIGSVQFKIVKSTPSSLSLVKAGAAKTDPNHSSVEAMDFTLSKDKKSLKVIEQRVYRRNNEYFGPQQVSHHTESVWAFGKGDIQRAPANAEMLSLASYALGNMVFQHTAARSEHAPATKRVDKDTPAQGDQTPSKPIQGRAGGVR